MKVIIDIPQETYNFLNKYGTDGGIVEDAVIDGIPISDNVTNGDIIKAIFPNGDLHDYDYYDGYVIYKLNYRDFKFDKDWWNAPYK